MDPREGIMRMDEALPLVALSKVVRYADLPRALTFCQLGLQRV
jgi:hypothetical protein